MKIVVVADLVSPWTYIGFLELNDALRQCADLPGPVDVEYRPFRVERLESLPEDATVDRREYWARKHGEMYAEGRWKMLADRAEKLGIDMLGGKVGQSTHAHRLMLEAYRRGGQTLQQPLLRSILVSCFEHEKCISDTDMLADCASRAKVMSKAEASQFFQRGPLPGEFDVVETMDREARQAGVTVVPCTIVNGTWAMGGAQSADVYVRVLRQIAATDSSNGLATFSLTPATA